MKSLITIADLDRWHACDRYDGERYSDSNLRRLLRGRPGWTPMEVADSRSISSEDRIWVLLCEGVLDDSMLHDLANLWADRAVRRCALTCGIAIVEKWAKSWLDGTDRSEVTAWAVRDAARAAARVAARAADEAADEAVDKAAAWAARADARDAAWATWAVWDSAWAAAWAVTMDAVRDVARDANEAAARAAAWDSARDAAWDSTRDAERRRQLVDIRRAIKRLAQETSANRQSLSGEV